MWANCLKISCLFVVLSVAAQPVKIGPMRMGGTGSKTEQPVKKEQNTEIVYSEGGEKKSVTLQPKTECTVTATTIRDLENQLRDCAVANKAKKK